MKVFSIVLLAVVLMFAGCKKDDPITPPPTDCSTQLETASRCKATLSDCDGEKLSSSVCCLGTNADGKTRCSNKTKNPCGFCTTHKAQWDGKCPIETKNACGYCDDHKDQVAYIE